MESGWSGASMRQEVYVSIIMVSSVITINVTYILGVQRRCAAKNARKEESSRNQVQGEKGDRPE